MVSWNVYKQDNQQITIYNVFNHAHFVKALVDMFKELKKAENAWLEHEINTYRLRPGYYTRLDKYLEKVRDEKLDNICKYNFWGKCEYEIILTDWPTNIGREEIYRLVSEDQEHFNKYGAHAYKYSPNLCIAEKIDIYDQLKLNWEEFKFYIRLNECKIKKLYKDEFKRYFKK